MKTISLSMVKNEGDFIESFIRLNAALIDQFLIVDDSSADDTLPILAALIKEGFPIQLFTVRSPHLGLEQQQGNILSSILDNALASAFDYAFLLDADEILLADRATAESQLATLAPHQLGHLPWVTHVPCEGDFFAATNPVKQLFRPKLREEYQYYKAVIPRALAAGAIIVPGNHGITHAGQPVTDIKVLSLPLGHFPVRNAEQLMAKALIGAHKLSIKRNRMGGEGYHWDRIVEQLRASGFRLDFADLQRIAAQYPLIDPANRQKLELGEAYPMAEVTLRFTRPHNSALARLDAFVQELCRDYRGRASAPPPAPTQSASSAPASPGDLPNASIHP